MLGPVVVHHLRLGKGQVLPPVVTALTPSPPLHPLAVPGAVVAVGSASLR